MTEYRVFVYYQSGAFACFTCFTLEDICDTIGTLKGVVAFNVFCVKE